MGIVWVRKKIGAGVDVGEKGRKDYGDGFTVLSDQPRESRSLILNSGQLPVFGSPHPDDPTSICVKVNPVQNRENPYLWDVSVEYSRSTRDREDPQDSQKQPDERRQKWSCQFTPLSKYYRADLDGRYFVDTALTPINPPPEIPIFVDEWTIKMYEPRLDRAKDRLFMNAVNEDAWIGCEAQSALVADISRQEVYLMGAYWFESTYKILVQPRILPANLGVVWDYKANDYITDPICPWDHLQPNYGPRELDDSSPPKPIPIKTGEYYDGVHSPLDLNGKQIPLTAGGALSQPPIYLYFRLVNRKNFYELPVYPPWLEAPPGHPHCLAD